MTILSRSIAFLVCECWWTSPARCSSGQLILLPSHTGRVFPFCYSPFSLQTMTSTNYAMENGNFDDMLKTGAAMAVRTLLADPKEEEATQQSDRVGGAVSVNVAAVDQSSIRIRTGLNATSGFQDDFFSQSFSSQTAFFNPGCLVVLKTATVDTSNARFTEVLSVDLPKDFYVRPTQPAFGQSRFFAAVRTGFYFRAHVNVASGVAGALLVYYVPHDVNPANADKRSLTMFPHTFVNFGTNAVAELMIPYVNDENFSRTDTDDLGKLHVCIWSKARVPTGVSTSITVQILGSMRQVDFQNPRAIPVSGVWQVETRNKVDIGEGPGTMNLANVNTTGKAQSLSLGMEETKVDERTVGAKEPIEDFLILLKIPVPIGTPDNQESGWFNWEVSATPGTAVYQSTLTPESLGPVFLAFCNSFSFWRGTMQLTITVFATPFNKGRLRICFFPNAETDFNFQQADNSINLFMDIGLDSSAVLAIPFSSFSWLRTTNLKENFGRLKIFVANELQTNLNAPNSLEGQITFTAGTNFEFIAPISRGVTYQGPLPDAIDSADGDTAASAAGLQSMENVGGGPQAPTERSAIVNFVDKKVTIVAATHTRSTMLFGRAMYLNGFTLPSAGALRVNLAAPNTGIASLLRLVSYFTGKVVVHVHNATNVPLMMAHTWEKAASYPFTEGADNFQLLSSLGAVVVPAGVLFSLEVPYYNERPFRVITFVGAAFGNLLVQPVRPAVAPAVITLWVSLHEPKFFFPRAIEVATVPTLVASGTTRAVFTPKDGLRMEIGAAQGGLSKDHLLDELTRTAVRRARRHVHNNLPQPHVCCMCLYVSDTVRKIGYVPHTPKCKQELRELGEGLDHLQSTMPNYWARVVAMYNTFTPRLNASNSTIFMQTMKLYWPEEAEEPDIGMAQSPEAMYLVRKPRGLYHHYGLHFGEQVIQLQSENPLDTVLTGTADIICTPYDNTWERVDETPANASMWAQIRECLGDKMKYGLTSNCETLARFLGSFPGIEQGQVVSAFLGLMVSCAVVGLAAMPQSGGFLAAAANMAKNGWAAASDATIKAFSVFTTAVLSTIQHSVKRAILRVIVEFGCLAILYCGNPTLLSTTALATIVMLRMTQTDDLPGSVRAMVTAMMEGDMVIFASAVSDVISEHANPEEKQQLMSMTVQAANDVLNSSPAVLPMDVGNRQGLKEFNAVSLGARHVDWWASKMVNFFTRLKERLFPTRKTAAVEWLEANTELCLQMITEADDVVVQSKTASTVRSAAYQKRLEYTLKRMQALRRICVAAGNGTITSLVTQLCVRMSLISKPCSEPETAIRVEPIGIWITGDPGVGKSWFSSHLQSEIAKQMNRPLHVYTQCTSSEYFDGYNGQWMHYVDDFGQTREEKDVQNMVNVISARHFPLPMADVQDKGYWYTSEIVMVTTNKTDFRSSVLTSEAALSRRFPIRMNLKVADIYKTPEGFLNVPQAMNDGSLADGSCWTVNKERSSLINIHLRETCDIKKIAAAIVKQLQTRIQITKIFNDRVGTTGPAMENYTPPDYADVVKTLRKDGVIVASPIHAVHGMDHLDFHFDVGAQNAPGPKKYMTERQLSNKPCEVVERNLHLEEVDIQSDIDFLGTCEEDEWELESLTTYQKIKIKPAVRTKFETAVSKMVKLSMVLRPWQGLITSVCSVLGAVAGSIAIWYYVTNKQPKPDILPKLVKSSEPARVEDPIITKPPNVQVEERAYAGMAPRRQTLVRPIKNPIQAAVRQSAVFNTGWAHCMRACLSIRTGGSDLYGVVAREHSFLFYEHGLESIGEDAVVHWNGLSHELKNYTVTRFTDENSGIRCELVMITMNDCPWRFKDMTKHFADPMDGGWGKLCYSNSTTYASYEVSGIKHISTLALMPTMDDVQRVTVDPFQILREHIVTCVVRYYFQGNAPGSCGGLLVQKQNGQYKLVGMHISGNPDTGLSHSATFHPFNIAKMPVSSCQGVVVEKRLAPFRAHVSSRTKIKPSPFYGLTTLTKEPAVLHPRDMRLQVKMENCLKENADKYEGNQYIVDGKDVWAMEEVKLFIKKKLFSVTGYAKETTWQEAVNGLQHSNPIDMSTSPGVKYVQQHKTKSDLFRFEENQWFMREDFAEDVSCMYQNFRDGVKVSTIFGTNLKDELRKTIKVYEGKTRVIEACSVDYVVVYRKIMGQLYDAIYNSTALSTGIAVGIDPMQDFHDLWCDITGCLYTIDYKQFDGNLPAGVMTQAVEILASCHEDPDLVKRLHEPVITSTHLVMDEEWDVEGGMPSGAPCTSVLNSLSNLVMVLFCLLKQDMDPECVQILTYGDDVLFTTQTPIDATKLTADLKHHFGMTATNAKKNGPIEQVPISEATFLKRNFGILPGTNRVVGVLDLETCLQNIQWCKSVDDFKQQFQSWTPELVLHGKELYTEIRECCSEAAAALHIYFPTWEEQLATLKHRVFNNG